MPGTVCLIHTAEFVFVSATVLLRTPIRDPDRALKKMAEEAEER